MSQERRGHGRRRVGRAAVFLLKAGGQVVGTAVPDDVSAGGVRLLVARAWAPGEELELTAQAPHPLAGREFPLRVVRCEPQQGGGYVLAGVFLTPLSAAEVRDLAGGP